MQEMARDEKTRSNKSVNIEEFKALVNNLKPTTLKQAEWICNEVERLTHENPELNEKLAEWCRMPESERRELAEFFAYILAQERMMKSERRKTT